MSQPINLDIFAGGGGASVAMTRAGYPPHVAVNHDPEAIAVHRANHPDCEHVCQDVFEAKPLSVTRGRPVRAGWFSPDCTHHSKAKGGKPLDNKRRSLAWVVVDYARDTGPGVIYLENVEEFADWGPLGEDGRPIKNRRGETFQQWTNALEALGYRVGQAELAACDYGAPTTRRRLYLCARRDGAAIETPSPTHTRGGFGGRMPWRAAAEIIDWSIPCPSIFMTREESKLYYERTGIRVNRPLKPKTMARIAKGVKRFVLDAQQPFIIDLTHAGGDRATGMTDPIRTITAAHRGEKALVTPFVTKFRTGAVGHPIDEPLHTITANSFEDRPGGAVPLGLVAPLFVPRYGERDGQAPRAISIEGPLPTIVPGANGASLVAAFLAQHNNDRGVEPNAGRQIEMPLSAVTATPQQGIVAAHLLNLKGTGRHRSPDDPLFAQCAGGWHIAQVQAFLIKYYGTGENGVSLFDPIGAITTKDRFGLITLHGVDYQIVDIGMRMLSLEELKRGQGLPDEYELRPIVDGKRLSNTSAIAKVGNSVSPYPAEAWIRANPPPDDLAEAEAA
jgi:DNA (cytosine-5)-methyltransferase 1